MVPKPMSLMKKLLEGRRERKVKQEREWAIHDAMVIKGWFEEWTKNEEFCGEGLLLLNSEALSEQIFDHAYGCAVCLSALQRITKHIDDFLLRKDSIILRKWFDRESASFQLLTLEKIIKGEITPKSEQNVSILFV